MTAVAGKVAAVTGAGSGIGRAVSLELARRGARLALSDISDEGLAETARLIGVEVPAAGVHTQGLDVSDREAFAGWVDAVVTHFGVVHQVYNNAGVASSRTVLDNDWGEYERVLGVNLWGVIHGSKLFLPHLIASGDGHLTNISSLNGYMAQDELSAYCAAKFAVRGFTEVVRMEMAKAGHPVRVTCVHPGGVKTNIATAGLEYAEASGLPVSDYDRARVRVYNDKLLRMDPAQAAKIILNGVEKNRARVLVGNDAKLVDVIVRMFPSHYERIVLLMNKLTIRG